MDLVREAVRRRRPPHSVPSGVRSPHCPPTPDGVVRHGGRRSVMVANDAALEIPNPNSIRQAAAGTRQTTDFFSSLQRVAICEPTRCIYLFFALSPHMN